MKELVNRIDMLISAVPRAYPMKSFMHLLKLDGTLVNDSALDQLQALNGMAWHSAERASPTR
jgi:alcohol dehydrogenase (NADP+)